MQRIRKGDTVEVLAGDDKGQRGQVHSVIPGRRRVLVSGINIVKKHQRRTGNVRTQTGIIEMEAPISLSNVAPVCRHCDRWTRVGYQVLAEGPKVRICRRCGAELD
jgi:large subunit ribosomal protein L24